MASKRSPENRTQAVVLLSVIVFALTMGLLFLWKVRTMSPRVVQVQDEIRLPPRPLPPSDVSPQGQCASVGGTWIDCGNPCHGAPPGKSCLSMCEPQCLCGPSSGNACPASQTCQQKDADGVGVCRPGKVPVPVPGETSTGTVSAADLSAPILRAGMLCDASNSICVTASVSGTRLANPFTVTGTAIAFENTANWRLLDGKGVTLDKGFFTTDASDVGKAGGFSLRTFLLHVPTTKTGRLEIFETSAEDGSLIHTVSLPVKLPQEKMTTNVAWYTEESKIGSQLPEIVNVIVPKTDLPIETALRATLGLTPTKGYKTACTAQTCPLKSLVVKNGVAIADFQAGTEGIWQDQIRFLLKSFPSVKTVHVQVNGQE
jgi:hypothetical protein